MKGNLPNGWELLSHTDPNLQQITIWHWRGSFRGDKTELSRLPSDKLDAKLRDLLG